MVVELIGGPFDGSVIDAPSHMPSYMVVSTHQEGPIYRAGCCSSCGNRRRVVPYYFLGYEETIRYEHPEKSQDIQAIEQEDTDLPNSQSRA